VLDKTRALAEVFNKPNYLLASSSSREQFARQMSRNERTWNGSPTQFFERKNGITQLKAEATLLFSESERKQSQLGKFAPTSSVNRRPANRCAVRKRTYVFHRESAHAKLPNGSCQFRLKLRRLEIH
jgi:hypothetical protein